MGFFGRTSDHQRRASDHEGRLSVVESQVSSLDAKVVDLRSSMRGEFHDLSTQISEMKDGTRTDWSVVIAAIGMVVTVLILAFTPLIYKLQENTDTIKDHKDKINKTSLDVAVIKSKINED